MSELDDAFAKAQQDVNTLSKKPDNDTLLFLYAHFKQATVGDASGKRPGAFDFVGKAKFGAWEDLKGTSGDAAKQAYVDKVSALLAADA